MEHGKELLLQAVSVILFCMAITMISHQATAYKKLIEQVKECYANELVLYEQDALTDSSEQGLSKDCCTYAQVIASLFEPLEYDLEINSRLISKYEHTADQIDDYDIAMTDYAKTYVYDSNGTVTRIIYTSITGG